MTYKIPCWRCCPMSMLEHGEMLEEEGVEDVEVGEHEECKKRNVML